MFTLIVHCAPWRSLPRSPASPSRSVALASHPEEQYSPSGSFEQPPVETLEPPTGDDVNPALRNHNAPSGRY